MSSAGHFIYVHFHPRPDWQPLLAWPHVADGIGQVRATGTTAQAITAALRDCVRHNASSSRRRELLAVNALEGALLLCDTAHPAEPRLDTRLHAALDLIEADLAGDLSLATLAAATNLSVSRFAHLFGSQLGVSPQRFVERRRLESAARLLDLDPGPVTAIAAAVGFADPLYFSTRFRRWYGLSPRAYRARRSR